MSHFPKPFFRPQRQSWYVQLSGKQINLGREREAAFDRYHKLMVEFRRNAVPPKAVSQPPLLVVVLIDKFLDWVHKNRSPETFEWYRYRLQRFAEKHKTLTFSDLRAFHVQEWVDGYRLSQTSRRNYLRSMKRCMQWGVRQGYLDKNPLVELEVPAGERRETLVTDEEFAALLAVNHDEALRELMLVTWETGCRPQESLRVEARHVDHLHRRWVFPKSEEKNKKQARVVYLTPTAWEIVERLSALHPTGRLFRNRDGRPWTTEAVNCGFNRLRERLAKALPAAQNLEISPKEIAEFQRTLKPERIIAGKKVRKSDKELRSEAVRKLRQRSLKRLVPNYSLYALRHSWATRALQRGVDPLTTAILMGHSDPSMLAKVYQHLALNPEHLRSQAIKAAN